MRKLSFGFSLIELLVVVLLLSITTGLVLSSSRWKSSVGNPEKIQEFADFLEKGWGAAVEQGSGLWLIKSEDYQFFFSTSPNAQSPDLSHQVFMMPSDWNIDVFLNKDEKVLLPTFITSDRQGQSLTFQIKQKEGIYWVGWKVGGVGLEIEKGTPIDEHTKK